ncbi:elongation factor 4 [Candidatus Peregrinibacteria bacterium CG11_big_fil_rev_8_21_14_0_20_46_8]|nr:MAG: elongation factor 4 [Candidatus Peregrinibacteria bacterium CG11_big_fil_rev_8_21_14_0_20_46_8]
MSHQNNIRNFCIIAHIDHGKSTLADRLLALTGTLTEREMKREQMLDSMELEQEKGITIKLAPVHMKSTLGGVQYELNLIDTPGHVDFSYEVSRSLAAVEGAILVVDATQGIQAQTLANAFLAIEHDLTIIPVLNKIDLPASDVERVSDELEKALAVDRRDIIHISAKTGENVPQLLQAIIDRVPPPKSMEDEETKALVFDSVYDTYKGVVTYVRMMSGDIRRGDTLKFLHAGNSIDVIEVGRFAPGYRPESALHAGDIGYIVTGVRSVSEARVGDTLWKGSAANPKPLPGYRKVTPFVYAGIFPTDATEYPLLRDALLKLSLNDSSLEFSPENSTALGHGFRCGFLGLLHMEIVQERLEREYDLDLIATAPSVSYELLMNSGEIRSVSNPSELPDRGSFREIREPFMKLEIITPREYIGKIITLCDERRGIQRNIQYLDDNRAILYWELPLAEIILDFYDALKSATAGFASMNYEFLEYRVEDLVKLDMHVAGEQIEALSHITHRSDAYRTGSILAKKLKKLIPRANFEIAIQAAIGAKIIARETIGALRKNVTEKLYGGDRTRKDKLLKKQKAGKKRMKKMGRVEIPQDAFLVLLKRNEEN